jgi:hypothetical protein
MSDGAQAIFFKDPLRGSRGTGLCDHEEKRRKT